MYADANEAFLSMAGRTRDQLIGRHLFDVFPDNPHDPAATGMRNLSASLERVAATGERDTMALQRYDVEDLNRPGVWQERYWSPVNVPVLAPDGSVVLLVHRVEEVTELIKARGSRQGGDQAQVLEAELYTRARELQQVNGRLRKAHAREREVALHLQEAMPPVPRPLDRHKAAVRYRPAVGALNVCGDWYDLVDMPKRGCTAVSVGDVVGHGLRAAGVMGLLRSALSAASHVAEGPAQALEVLGLYARTVEGAESTTAVSVYIDWNDHTLTYSSAGHPPPALCHPDGTVTFLDQATDPPLGATPGARSAATGPHRLHGRVRPRPLHRRSHRAPRRGHRRRPHAPRRLPRPASHHPPGGPPRHPRRRPPGRPDPADRPHRRHRPHRRTALRPARDCGLSPGARGRGPRTPPGVTILRRRLPPSLPSPGGQRCRAACRSAGPGPPRSCGRPGPALVRWRRRDHGR
ncbi:hypothetical protein SNARM312S_02741 [Streptomyces narbonensis]